MRSALQLDFIASPGRARLLGACVLATALLLAGALMSNYREARERIYRLEAVENLLSTQSTAATTPSEGLEEQRRSAQIVARQLALPWAQLIDALERAAMKEVALLNIQPDAQQRLLRLTAVAPGEEAMLHYLRRLAATERFAEVHLVSHQVLQDDPRRPLQFSVQASFRPEP